MITRRDLQPQRQMLDILAGAAPADSVNGQLRRQHPHQRRPDQGRDHHSHLPGAAQADRILARGQRRGHLRDQPVARSGQGKPWNGFKLNKQFWSKGQHTTEVVFALPTQPSTVRFLVLLNFFKFGVAEIYQQWPC